MWQQFTERARRVILLAQEEAGKMNSAHVGTEHLLLGLVRENEGVAAQVLQKMGVDLEKVRNEIEAVSQTDEVPSVSEPKLTAKTKRVLELAADEARRLRHNYIGTEHLLLALLREKDELAAKVLHDVGFDLEESRAYVLDYLGSESPEDVPESQPSAELTPVAKRVLEFAVDEARQMKHNEIGTGHLLLALLHETDGIAAKILGEADLDLESVRERVLQERDAE